MVNILPKLELSFSNHKEFHLYYLTKHRSQWCKRLHLIGTIVGVVGAAVGAVRMDPVMVVGSTIVGAATAWVGDAVIEKETPTTFKYPLWSIYSNFKVVQAMIKGDMSI